MPTESGKPLIVISYAHADEPEHPAEGEVKWLSFVTGYLRPAIGQGAIEVWTDSLLQGGDDWLPEIESRLRACDVYVLLVSSNSMASTWINREVETIRRRQANGEGVQIYPLVVKPTPEAGLQLVGDKNLAPRSGRPFSDYPPADREHIMSQTADEIVRLAVKIADEKKAAPNLPSTDPPIAKPESGDAAPPIKPRPPPVDGVFGFSPDNIAGASGPDVLGVEADAQAIARLMCLEGAAPSAIAVLGGWGWGKSTFMERLDREVRNIVLGEVRKTAEAGNPVEARMVERVVQIRFNA
jgi:hypothetical protein